MYGQGVNPPDPVHEDVGEIWQDAAKRPAAIRPSAEQQHQQDQDVQNDADVCSRISPASQKSHYSVYALERQENGGSSAEGHLNGSRMSQRAGIECYPADDSLSDDVCYGMIPEVNCQRLALASQYDVRLLESNLLDKGQISLVATVKQNACMVSDRDGTALFMVNTKISNVISNGFRTFGIRLEPYAQLDSLLQAFEQKRAGKNGKVTMRLNLNVYGSKHHGDGAGRLFSDAGIYLQNPMWLARSFAYCNPQLIAFPHLSQVDVWMENLLLPHSAPQTDMTRDWTLVLDDLPPHHASINMANGHLMHTKLFEHQAEARTYMQKRETGNIEQDLKFWTPEIDFRGICLYRHSITGATDYRPQIEPQSGILADHMGLGKTLSTISLIVSSLDRAKLHDTAFTSVLKLPALSRTPTKATIVVVPSVLLMQEWEKEIQRHTVHGALRVARYHGHDRARHFSELRDVDVVLTTFGTVAKEFQKSYNRGREVLYYLNWFRIVLDEAHTVRSRRTRQFEAVLAIEARHHWCLTGTPVSNKVDDLAALLQICRVPFLERPDYFRDYVSKPARQSFPQGCRILRQLLSPLCLRRTKALLNIPPPRMVQYVVRFADAQRCRYRELEEFHHRRVDESVSRQNKRGLRNTMLRAILELRICCNLGTFMPVKQDDEEDLDPDQALALLEEQDEASCAVCSHVVPLINALDDPSSGALGSCSHIICASCLDSDGLSDDHQHQYRCPVCKTQTYLQCLEHGPSQTPATTLTPSLNESAKLNRLVQDLVETQEAEKSIVFSFFRKTLDIAADMCRNANLNFVRIDGSVAPADRGVALDAFTKSPDITVLLMTLGTGALGLNLTAASRIHILEPQWNPAVEDQAIGRAVRIGQEQNATIIRYIVEHTVEQHIQTYQRRKRHLVAGGFGDRIEDLEVENTLLNERDSFPIDLTVLIGLQATFFEKK